MSKKAQGNAQTGGVRFQFGDFTLDLETRQLSRAAQVLHLTPKAFELLTTLVQERPRVISKKELLERLWPDTFVAEANLSNLVAEIRDVLEDRARAPLFIRTAHGFGYAFCGSATALAAARGEAAVHPACWLEWDRQRFPLSFGEHVIGRDPDVDVRLDQSTVSRRHARLLVTADGTMLEDFGSKNGTFRCHERVTAPVPLVDGDSIGIGSLVMTFHCQAPSLSTDTQVP